MYKIFVIFVLLRFHFEDFHVSKLNNHNYDVNNVGFIQCAKEKNKRNKKLT